MDFISSKPENVLEKLNSSYMGLSEEEAERRLSIYGKNELKRDKGPSPLMLFLSQFNSLPVYLLVAASVMVVLSGNHLEGILLLSLVFVISLIGFIDEQRLQKEIQKIAQMVRWYADVIRDGSLMQIDKKEIVPGDIVMVKAGDLVPADARLFEAVDLEIDESILTKKSDPIKKGIALVVPGSEIGKQTNIVFSGTKVLKGKGSAIVTKTGMDSEISSLTEDNQQALAHDSIPDNQTDSFYKILKYMVMVACLGIIAFGVLNTPGYKVILSETDLLDFWSYLDLLIIFKEIVLISLALAVAAIPRRPLSLISTALRSGLRRMAANGMLIMRLSSLDKLRKVTAVCINKGDCLAAEEMSVRKIFFNGMRFDVKGEGRDTLGEFLKDGIEVKREEISIILKIGALTNNAKLDMTNQSQDPVEVSLLVSAAKAGLKKEELEEKYPRIKEMPFSHGRKVMSTLHKDGDKNVLFVKGSVDVIIDSCTKALIGGKVRAMTPELKAQILGTNTKFREEGLSTIGFAFKIDKAGDMSEEDLIFVGFQAISNPIKSSVKETIERYDAAGIKVVMMTGDQTATARAIGSQIGLGAGLMTAKEVDSAHDLKEKIGNISIYSEVSLEHKAKIVSALKEKGHIVAMVGKSIDDIDALMNSDIKISKADASDSTKEIADIIIERDTIESAFGSVKETRGMHIHFRRSLTNALSSSMYLVLFVVAALIIGLGFSNGELIVPLLGFQLLCIHLIANKVPSFTIGIEPPKEGIMQRYRKNLGNLMTKEMVVKGMLIAIIASGLTLALFYVSLETGDLLRAQVIVVSTIIIFELIRMILVQVQTNAGLGANRNQWIAIVAGLVLLLCIIYIPTANLIFETVPLSLFDWAYVAAGAGVFLMVSLIASSFVKIFFHRSS